MEFYNMNVGQFLQKSPNIVGFSFRAFFSKYFFIS